MSKKIILYIATSVDGFIAEEDGSVSWLDEFNSEGADYGYKHFYDSITTVVMGKKTYEQIITFGEFPYKGKQCFVFGNDATDSEHVEFVSGDVKAFIEDLDDDIPKSIWVVGGAHLIKQFLEYNLVDEMMIFIMPVILGKGIRLFLDSEHKERLNLLESKSYESGAVEVRYGKGK